MSLFYKRTTLYILLVSTIIMIVLMFFQGKPLGAGSSIIALELAPNAIAVEAVLDTWSEASPDENDLIKVAVGNTRLDFIFLLSYSLLLFTAARQMGAYFRLKPLFNVVAYAALLAGCLDVVENIGMLQSLRGNISDGIAFTTATAAYFKWALAAGVVLFLLVGFIIKIFHRKPGPV